MKSKPAYLSAAFNARPFGMPIPPNWMALAAIGLLGWFVHPGCWLIGAGLELTYLVTLCRNPRFRKTVEGQNRGEQPDRHATLLNELPKAARATQIAIQKRCQDLIDHVRRLDADSTPEHIEQLTQLCWLHLRLLVARTALAQVTTGASAQDVSNRTASLRLRLNDQQLDPDIRKSLEAQLTVLDDRSKGHQLASTRVQVLDAELDRIAQQIELAREQVLLATDANSLSRSVDVIAGSLGQANAWLRDQRDLFADIDPFADAPPSDRLFSTTSSSSTSMEST